MYQIRTPIKIANKTKNKPKSKSKPNSQKKGNQNPKSKPTKIDQNTPNHPNKNQNHN